MSERSQAAEYIPIPRIDNVRCDGCGICVHVCRNQVLMVEKGKAIVANPWACTYSGLCELACPRKAIERPFEIILVSSPQMKSGKLQPKREKENKS